MKKLIIASIFSLFLSCEVEGELSRVVQEEPIAEGPVSEETIAIKSGEFIPTSGISVVGSVSIVDDNDVRKVILSNFSISSGPDLKVYLSKAEIPSGFVNLGALTSATVYNIPDNVEVSEYDYVLIHCQQYNHLFAIAKLN